MLPLSRNDWFKVGALAASFAGVLVAGLVVMKTKLGSGNTLKWRKATWAKDRAIA